MAISRDFDAMNNSKIEAHIGQSRDFELSERRRNCESLIENGQNFGNRSKIGHQKVGIRNSKFELKKSRYTKAERLPAKYRETWLYKVNIVTEKSSSRIRIDLPDDAENVLEGSRYSCLSRGMNSDRPLSSFEDGLNLTHTNYATNGP
jgi:hypothetical protein